MYERTYGPKYNDIPQYASAAEIAKAVRADLKAAIKAGELPDYPEGVKFSVRSETFAGGMAVNITVKNAPEEWVMVDADPDDPYYYPGYRRVSPEAIALGEKLREILNAYNHDGSDSMSDYWDVRYYGQVYALGGLLL